MGTGVPQVLKVLAQFYFLTISKVLGKNSLMNFCVQPTKAFKKILELWYVDSSSTKIADTEKNLEYLKNCACGNLKYVV